jgi:hypothetical protein
MDHEPTGLSSVTLQEDGLTERRTKATQRWIFFGGSAEVLPWLQGGRGRNWEHDVEDLGSRTLEGQQLGVEGLLKQFHMQRLQ